MATIKKVVDRIGNTIYPVTHAQAVIGIGGKTVYENIEELMGGGSSGINLLPTILDIVFFTSDIESNPLPQDAEDGSYAIGDDHLFRMVDGSWEMQENPKYFFFKYDNIMYSYTDGTTQEEFDFNTEHEVEHIPPFIEILDSAATPPPESVASNGYYVYYNQQEVPVIFKYHNGTWTEQTEDILPKAYVVFGNLLFTYEGGQLNANPVPYGNGSSTQIQADWNQTNTSAKDYIKNKPEIDNTPTQNSNNLVRSGGVFAAIQNASGGVQSDWNQTNANAPDYIKNKPDFESTSEEDPDETHYPEYYLTSEEKESLRYCPNYYAWNTVWYQDNLENVPTSSIAGTNGVDNTKEVTFPSDLFNTAASGLQEFCSGKYFTKDVFYAENLGQFVLKIDDSAYLTTWKNSYLWNTNGAPRTDTVYCRIKHGNYVNYFSTPSIYDKAYQTDDSNHIKWFYVSYFPYWYTYTKVYQNGDFVDINDTFTDFKNAIRKCKNANGGNIKFHGNKIYGITHMSDAYNWNKDNNGNTISGGLKNFVIDGQGATICVICRITVSAELGAQFLHEEEVPTGVVLPSIADKYDAESGYTYKYTSIWYKKDKSTWNNTNEGYTNDIGNVFGINNSCDFFTVKNIALRGVCNAAQNTASNTPPTFNRCPVTGINIYNSSGTTSLKNAVLENITYSGLSHDFRNESSKYGMESFTVHGWYSEDSGSCFVGTRTLVIEDSKVKTSPHVSRHMIYMGSAVRNLTVRNSEFEQNTIWNTNIVQAKRDESTLFPEQCNHVYEGCTFKYVRGMLYHLNQTRVNVVFRNCTMLQTEQRYNGNLATWDGDGFMYPGNYDKSAFFNTTFPASLKMENNSFHTYGKVVYYGTSSSTEEITFVFRNNYIRVVEPSRYYIEGTDTTTVHNRYSTSNKLLECAFLPQNRFIERNITSMIEDSGIVLCDITNTRGFEYMNDGLPVDQSLDTTSLNPVSNTAVSTVLNPIKSNVAQLSELVVGISADLNGTLALLPKGAALGTTYYATDTRKLYTCVHEGSNTKARFLVARLNPEEGNDFIIKGRLRIFFGLESDTYATASEEEREKLCVVDIRLDSTQYTNLDISDSNKLRDWIVQEINKNYPNFTSKYGTRTRMADVYNNNTSGLFNVLTFRGFNGLENVIESMNNGEHPTWNVGTWVLYEPDDGVDSLMSITRRIATGSQPANAVSAHLSAYTNVHNVIHSDSTHTDIRIADHHLSSSELTSITNYMKTVNVSTDNTNLYYIYGFDAIWEETGYASQGIKDKVDTLEETQGIMSRIMVKDTSPSGRSNWYKGELWYDTTNSLLKRYNGTEFVNVTDPCMVSYVDSGSTLLYFWTGTTLHTITIGNIVS